MKKVGKSAVAMILALSIGVCGFTDLLSIRVNADGDPVAGQTDVVYSDTTTTFHEDTNTLVLAGNLDKSQIHNLINRKG